MADAGGLNPPGGNFVRVRVPPWAQETLMKVYFLFVGENHNAYGGWYDFSPGETSEKLVLNNNLQADPVYTAQEDAHNRAVELVADDSEFYPDWYHIIEFDTDTLGWEKVEEGSAQDLRPTG